MKIAIPTRDGRVFPDCGESGQLAVVDLDESTNIVRKITTFTSSLHAPGELPGWLRQLGVDTVVARGLGRRVRELLAGKGIRVIVGVPPFRVEAIIARFLSDTLEAGADICEQ
jgi:predicted Fe-Mo cluster-binding NifX family protein